MSTISWSDPRVVDEVIEHGKERGWTHHRTQQHQGQLVILHKPNPNGGVKLMKINVWCTTGTVGSYLKHPKQGNTQLFRRDIASWGELDKILDNPRVHTTKGYQRKKERKSKEVAADAVPERTTAPERGDVDVTPPAKSKRRAVKTGTPKKLDFDSEVLVRGTVKFFDARVRMYGFVTPDGSDEDIWFHRNYVKKGNKVYKGTQVEFKVVECPKGHEARKVKVLKD